MIKPSKNQCVLSILKSFSLYKIPISDIINTKLYFQHYSWNFLKKKNYFCINTHISSISYSILHCSGQYQHYTATRNKIHGNIFHRFQYVNEWFTTNAINFSAEIHIFDRLSNAKLLIYAVSGERCVKHKRHIYERSAFVRSVFK